MHFLDPFKSLMILSSQFFPGVIKNQIIYQKEGDQANRRIKHSM
jgi:hypothetical protein